MTAIFPYDFITTPSKQFACLQNIFFRHFIPFLPNDSLK